MYIMALIWLLTIQMLIIPIEILILGVVLYYNRKRTGREMGKAKSWFFERKWQSDFEHI